VEKEKKYIKYNKETKEYSILLKYSPEDIMDGDYYYRVGSLLELNDIVKQAIANDLDSVGATYDDKTIKWFMDFFMDEELVDIFNEDIYKVICEFDEDFVKRMERRIELHDNDITDYSNPNEKPVNWR
jgi:hypothetical protein